MFHYATFNWIVVLRLSKFILGIKLYLGKQKFQILVRFKIGAVTHFYFSHIFVLPTGKYVIHCIRGNQISHVQSMVAKRGLTNWANIHTPMWTKSFKAQHDRVPIDPAILAAIGHRFIAQKKIIKYSDALVWGDVRGDQKPGTFLGMMWLCEQIQFRTDWF